MGLFAALNGRISRLQLGLQPETLRYWHHTIQQDARARAPPWLQDRINVHQHPHLPMKFSIDISRRAVKYYMMAVDSHLDEMSPSTRLYFLRVCETLSGEMDKRLV